MAVVRFKFRSSATFDSVDIGAQSSISIRDLKSKIVLKNHLNLSQDFDLVFSDFLSGQEYKDENVQIPSGSSVIIKRVPACSTPSLRVCDVSAECIGGRDINSVNVVEPPTADVGVNDLDDFGVHLCPPPDSNLSDIWELQSNNNGQKDSGVARCSEELLVRCQKLEASHPSQSTPKDSTANQGSTLVMQSKPKTEEQIKVERTSPAKHLAMENSDMPSELKCSLCRTFFKEAVMIPCCQHSFCEKCICLALAENRKCPMCSSTKCTTEDLLPNVSLRQAIERFLESELLNGSENDLQRYAPDGESGIQVKSLSHALNVPQRHLQQKQSATGNQTIQNKLLDHAHLGGTKIKPGTFEDFTEFQGENEPQNMAGTNEEANSCTRKGEGFRVIAGGGEKNFTAVGRLNRGPRTCYMCGSPDHLIRDCPIAASSSTNHCNGVAPFPGGVPGFTPSYWPGSPPHVRPFMNMCGGPGVMLFNTTTPPITPFAFPSYAPSTYSGYPVASGYTNLGLGGITPVTGNNAQQPRHTEPLELQGFAKQQRNWNGDMAREKIYDRDHNVNMKHDYTERDPYHSGDSFGRRSEGKHRSHDRSDEDTSCSNGKRQEKKADSRIQHREDRHAKHHITCRRYDEMGAQHDRDSSQKHHQPNKSIKRRRMEYDEKKSDRKFHHHSRSGLEPSYSSDDARQRREESGRRSRHPEKIAKPHGKEIHYDRAKMSKYSDNDCREDYHSHKRKRFH